MNDAPSPAIDTPELTDSETGSPRPIPLYLFAASCPGLRDWSVAAGIDVQFLGLSTDPLAAVAEMSDRRHASAGLVFDEVVEDGPAWARWALVPLPDPHGVLDRGLGAGRDWGGTVRVDLEHASDVAVVQRRFAALCWPLSVAALFNGPQAIRTREERRSMPPAAARLSRLDDGYKLADGLYRLSCQSDLRAVLSALDAAAASLAGTDAAAALDLIAAADAGASRGWVS